VRGFSPSPDVSVGGVTGVVADIGQQA
jgi:hypothetical protein